MVNGRRLKFICDGGNNCESDDGGHGGVVE